MGKKLTPEQLDALKAGKGVDLHALIAAVKHEALWVIIAVASVCVLYFVAKRLTAKPA